MSDKPEDSVESAEDDQPEVAFKRSRTESQPISVKTDETHARPLPGFVAGNSPAKSLTPEQFKEFVQVSNELANMAIAHEISMDPDFSVEGLKEKTSSELTKKVEEIATKAFYDNLRDKLKESPPDYEAFFGLYAELKDMAMEAMTTASGKIFDSFDADEPRRQHKNNCLDLRGLLLIFLEKLAKTCAPIRDSEVEKLRTESDVVDLLAGLHKLLTDMKHDMLNFTIKQSRYQILQHSVQMECQKFLKLLKFSPHLANETRSWLAESVEEYKKSTPGKSQITKVTLSELPQILAIGFARLLDGTKTDDTFPETLKYDLNRVKALARIRLRLVITLTSVFLSANLAGKDVCEKTDFKQVLKNNILAILEGIDKNNVDQYVENIFLESDKQMKTFLKDAWTPNLSSILKQQIQAIDSGAHSVRKLVEDRLFSVISAILVGPGALPASGFRIPPGLSIIEAEIVQLISKYLTVTVHNFQSFAHFYLDAINEHLDPDRGLQASTSKTT